MFRTVVFLASVCMACRLMTAETPHRAAHLSKLQGKVAQMALQESGGYDAIRTVLERARHQVEPAKDGSFRATSDGRLALAFNPHEVRLTATNATVGLRFASYGYGERLRAPVAPSLAAEGNRVEYRRGSLTEWYNNESRGLEQGFTFAERPGTATPGDPLVIALETTGDLTPTLEPGGKAILLSSGRSAILRYGGLRAWDANGREMTSRMEVSNREIRLVVEDAGAAYPLVVDPWVQQAKLFASDIGALDNSPVAIDGNTVIIGAAGAAYVFLLSNGTWIQQAKLTVPCGGSQVAVSGDTIVVSGCPDATGRGSVYVFTRTGSSWTQQAQLSSGIPNDLFGQSVAIDGNTLVIGAPGTGGLGIVGVIPIRGAAYVYVLSNGAWTQQATLTRGALDELFGGSVSISADTLVVGAPAQSGGYQMSLPGSTFVFLRSGSSWTPQADLVNQGGWAVSLDGGTVAVLVGPQYSSLQDPRMRVYVRTGSTWAQQFSFGDNFSPSPISVAVSGDTLVLDSGKLFTRSGGVWALSPVALAPSPHVALSGGNLMIGPYWYTYTAPNVTVQSNLPGRQFNVSGTGCGSSGPFTTPYGFLWPGGTACAVSFTTPDTSTPGIRYAFKGWEGGVATNPRTMTASSTPATYTADFTTEYLLTANRGTVTASPTSPDGYYNPGTIVQLSALPSFGYSFAYWTGDLSGTANPQSVTMNGPRSVTANFSQLPTYVISGLVTSSDGHPLSGVTVALGGGPFSPTSTDLSGHYLFQSAPSGGPYAVTPSLAGYIFAPLNITFSNLSGNQTANFVGSANNPSQFPSLVSLDPFQGTGPNATLSLVYSDANGWAAINSAEFIVNPRWEATSRGGGCYLKYAPGTGLFTLIADDGNSIAGTVAPGSANSISNSQCTLNAASSSVTGSGTNLTVVASLTFQPTFTGQRHIWMQAVDYNNVSTNWMVYGVWFPTQTTVNAIPWYRIYDPFSNTYLYSADPNEYTTLGARGFALQGTSGLVMDGAASVGGVSNIAFYRVFVNSTSSHFWTSDRNEFLTLINLQQNYVGEGVAAFAVPYLKADGTWQLTPPTNMIPFYRAAFQGANLHFWTADADEYFGRNGKRLPTGYLGEGIACYIFPTSGAVWSSTAPAIMETTPAPVEPDDGGPSVVAALNGASRGSSGVIAPGQVLSVYGRHLGGATLLLNGAPVEVISAKDNEIRVVVPRDFVSGMEVSLEVEHRGRRSKAVRLGVVAANPAIFGSNEYGRGNAQAQNEDGVINGEQHPVTRGSVVTLYTTGMGAMDLPVEVHIGGRAAEVISTLVSATRAGVVEVRVRVPETVEAAAFQPVVLHVGNMFSQPGVGLAIR